MEIKHLANVHSVYTLFILLATSRYTTSILLTDILCTLCYYKQLQTACSIYIHPQASQFFILWMYYRTYQFCSIAISWCHNTSILLHTGGQPYVTQSCRTTTKSSHWKGLTCSPWGSTWSWVEVQSIHRCLTTVSTHVMWLWYITLKPDT